MQLTYFFLNFLCVLLLMYIYVSVHVYIPYLSGAYLCEINYLYKEVLVIFPHYAYLPTHARAPLYRHSRSVIPAGS